MYTNPNLTLSSHGQPRKSRQRDGGQKPHHNISSAGLQPVELKNRRTEGPESRTDGETLILWDR